MNKAIFVCKVTGKGKAMKLVPFPDARKFDVVSVSIDKKTHLATLECVRKVKETV